MRIGNGGRRPVACLFDGVRRRVASHCCSLRADILSIILFSLFEGEGLTMEATKETFSEKRDKICVKTRNKEKIRKPTRKVILLVFDVNTIREEQLSFPFYDVRFVVSDEIVLGLCLCKQLVKA